MPARSARSTIRFASAPFRASGLVQSAALPCCAQSATASSCNWLGSPITTAVVSGCATASSIDVDHSGTSLSRANAAARSSERE